MIDISQTEIKRHRHPKLDLARQLSEKPHFYSPEARSQLTEKCELYGFQYLNGYSFNDPETGERVTKNGVKDRMIVLKNQKDEIIAIPYLTRFSYDYIQRQLVKMKEFFNFQIRKLHHRRGLFLTLTLDPSSFMTIREGYEKGQKSINTFLTRCRQIWPDMQYIQVKEIQEKNTKNVHWHLLLLGVPEKEEFADLVSVYWPWGFSKLEEVGESDDGGMYQYLTKYLKKSLEDEPGKINGTKLWLWAMMIRSWSSSRFEYVDSEPAAGLDKATKNNSNDIPDVWVYMGCFPVELPWDRIAIWDDLIKNWHPG